ncbi:Sodium/potassium/calcium exchanger 3 [Takifugu flavidus]|uniref:Sodium/potassium/calcium exchanger 3 n=1 Tax=Takifugu flavidus TaxID=433684 RepID=A0A5C6MLC7_9TELE|nr:Sodium/potassium/calcium exchanger 3 [Takifugu flavidus]
MTSYQWFVQVWFPERAMVTPSPKRDAVRFFLVFGSLESSSGVGDFPKDIFTLEQKRHGAVLLHVLCAIYMFLALAIVCDVYFVPSLEKLSENLHLSQDVAGATFMAAGSSAPELFTSLIGVFITEGDVGVGTIVGSAVFNILVIIGICGIFAGQPISLSWWPLFRDAVFYILSILVLILVIYDEKVMWWETIILISMYGIYIIIMKFNRSLYTLVESQCSRAGQPCLGSLRRSTAVGSVAEGDNDMVPLKPGRDAISKPSDTVSMSPMTQLRRSARTRGRRWWMRRRTHTPTSSPFQRQASTFFTQHFSPITHLHMAAHMVMGRQRLIRARLSPEEGGAAGEESSGGDRTMGEGGMQQKEEEERGKGAAGVRGGGAQQKEEVENEDGEEEGEEEEEEEEEAPFKPFVMPDGWCLRLRWLLSWPVSVLLHCTIPNCSLPQWERWYLLTFLTSTLWIALFSYLMVWMVTIISFTLGIPEVIMGITFLAAGTSVPDCMASLIVARQGMGDMAVSNSIGSNIFDVLLGLGFPWALRTLIVSYGSMVTINSKGLVYSVILLLASVTLTVVCVHLNCWRLDRRLGLSLILLYVVFLLCSVGFEKL